MVEIVKYEKKYEDRWDAFVNKEGVNGTFLQTRRFLNYHPTGRFKDASIMIMQGTAIVAVIPACMYEDGKEKQFISHAGSTFGGIVVHKQKYSIKNISEVFECLEEYFRMEGYTTILLKQASNLFSKSQNDLFEYFFYKNNWECYKELSFYVDLKKSSEDIISNFSVSRRRDYKYSLKNNLIFRRLESRKEIELYYEIIKENLLKFNQKPVHTLEELFDFKEKRLNNIVDFYGVYTSDGELLAGSMVFYFDKRVFHTQYLAQKQREENKKLFVMEFLNYNLIACAKEQGYDYFSFGISTEDKGKTLNMGLALFKEGFGCELCNNVSYIKKIELRE